MRRLEHQAPWLLFASLASLASSATGCVGSIGDDGANDGGPPSPTSSAEGCTTDDPVLLVGTTPLIRLTRNELDNTLRDLLDDDTRPSSVLPEDDRIGPFTSNAITPLGTQSVFAIEGIADQVSRRAVTNLDALLPCDPVEGEACALAFVESFGRFAFRRPLDATELDGLMAVFRVGDEEDGLANGIRLVLSAILQSPSFLYRVELGTPVGDQAVARIEGYEVATRLSFFLWKSTPDQALLDAAATGALDTSDGLVAEAERLLADPRADATITQFHEEWLGVEPAIASMSKNADLYPEFGEATVTAMRAQLDAFVRHVFREDDARLATFLTARYTFVNDDLAWIYEGAGLSPSSLGPADAGGFSRIDLDPAHLGGVLALPAVLATHAGPTDTSPTLRGKLVRNQLLCDVVPPPPPSASTEIEASEGTTRREQLAAHSASPECAGCHLQMDPIGLGFEGYDAVGAFRGTENGVPVDTSGEVFATEQDVAGPFATPAELALRLASSDTVARCMTRQWTRFALGREVDDEEVTCGMRSVDEAFAASGYDVRALLLAIIRADAFRLRRAVEEEQ